MEQEKVPGTQLLAHPFRHQGWCPPLQLSWMKFRTYVRHCIVYSPETFSSQNELCRKTEAKIQASKPRNPIESGIKALNAAHLLPSHDTAKPLATAYFNTWERLYRVVHRHSFWKTYYDTCAEITQSSLGSRVLTLAILILGQQATDQNSIEDLESAKARLERFSKWTECVENYCFLLVDNQRLDLMAMQTLCLFTLYKTTTCDRNEARSWAQRLVKCAVQADLHVDPSELKAISVFDMEIRRRLWATIMEIDIQVSLEHGNSLPWTSHINHQVLQPSNLDDVQLHPHLELTPLETNSVTLSDCCLQRALYRCGKLRVQLLKETFRCENEDKTNDMILISYIMHALLKRLEGISSVPDVSSWDAESKLLLRLHILRTSLRVMQGLTFRAADFCQLRDALAVYHKYALDYLQIYLKLSPSTRNGSLLSSTIFEALSPVMYIDTDGFPLSSFPSPSQKIIDFVKSWSKYEFEDLDCLTDRALRERLLFYLLSHYLKSKGQHSIMSTSLYETASWRYGRLCLALAQRRRTPIFYMEISEMAWSGPQLI